MFQEDPEIALARFAKDVFTGLQRNRKTMSSKYMYDGLGSEIYEEIMDLPEYSFFLLVLPDSSYFLKLA